MGYITEMCQHCPPPQILKQKRVCFNNAVCDMTHEKLKMMPNGADIVVLFKHLHATCGYF